MLVKVLICAGAVALWCSLPGCGSPNSQPAEQGGAHVSVDPTRQWVSIDAKNAPVRSVLLALSEQARFSLTVSDGGDLGRVTVVVKNIPLEEGIQRVLGDTPYTLTHAVEENGLKIVASVDLRPGTLDRVDSRQPPSAMTAAGVGDFGWGADRGTGGGSGGGRDRAAELSAALESLSLDTVKQLISEAKDPALRLSMLDALTERGDQNAVRPLFLESLQDADADVRGAALEHLQTSYEPIPLGPLADAVARETNAALRIEALALLSDQASAVGRTKEDLAAATASVNRAIVDPDPAVREQAQWSLEELSQAGAPAGFK